VTGVGVPAPARERMAGLREDERMRGWASATGRRHGPAEGRCAEVSQVVELSSGTKARTVQDERSVTVDERRLGYSGE
jgi:hypothetical protein